MRATLFPPPSGKNAAARHVNQPNSPTQRHHVSEKGAIEIPRNDEALIKSSFTPQSVASEWIAAYDNIISPGSISTAAPPPNSQQCVHTSSAPSSTRDRHAAYCRSHGQESSQGRPSQESTSRSPSKLTFASTPGHYTPVHEGKTEYISRDRDPETIETRRANSSPTRDDLRFKPLPQSPQLTYSDPLSLDPSNYYYEYLAPRPLNIQGKGNKQVPENTADLRPASEEEHFDWFKANNLPHPKSEQARETVWFTPQPATEFYTSHPDRPFAYVDNPPVVYRQIQGGPVQASVGGSRVYRKSNDEPQRGNYVGSTTMTGRCEPNHSYNQSSYPKTHHKATSDVSEYGYRPQYAAEITDALEERPYLAKSQSQKHYRHTPPEILQYDQVPDLEHTPGGHTHVVRLEDRSSGSTTSGPRGRPFVRTQRSRSLSPAKVSFDIAGAEEDDEYVFCDDTALPRRSRSPMKQMFGEKGWLHRGNSMNQVASSSPKKKGLRELAKLVMQKTDDKVSYISHVLTA